MAQVARDGGTTIEEVSKASAEVLQAVNGLIPQLSSSAPAMTEEELAAIVSSPSSILLIAKDETGRVTGTLTLALYRAPTGVRAWIEDVVVDGGARRSGIGAALTREALLRAAEHGARSVDLTSRPSREAANRLYQSLGFSRRETNVYRFEP